MVIKMIALCHRYFLDSAWNRFDFLIVLGTDLGIIMNIANIGIDISTTATVIRSFRIMRIFRLLKSYGRVVLDTLMNILPQITNIMGLIFLLLFIYSVLGISLFADVKYGDYYNKNNNFRNFPQSVILLFRCMTGEDWNQIMTDLADTSNCASDQTYAEVQADGVNGCGSWYAYPYFISYMIVLQMIIINLTVAAVIDGLSSARKDNTGVIKKDEINELVEIWSEYDPKATGWIDVTSLVFLLFELPQPMGYGKDHSLLNNNNNDSFASDGADIEDILMDTNQRMDELKNKIMEGHQINPDDMSNATNEHHQRIARLRTLKEKKSEEDFLINTDRNITLRKLDAIKVLEHFNIPYYENKKVHFKDVCKQVIDNTFDTKNQHVEIGTKLKKRIQRGWQKKYNLKKHKKISIEIQKIMAATVLLRWIRFYKAKKKARHEDVTEHMEAIEGHISKSLYKSVHDLHNMDPSDEDKESVKRVLEFERPLFGKDYETPNHRRSDHLSDEYNNFMKNNPEFFQSNKHLKGKKIKRKPKQKRSTFKTIADYNKTIDHKLPMGDFFKASSIPSNKIQKSKVFFKLCLIFLNPLKTLTFL